MVCEKLLVRSSDVEVRRWNDRDTLMLMFASQSVRAARA
jgi:hypothetical protein